MDYNFDDFEKKLLDVCIGWIGEEPGFDSYIKDCARELRRIAFNDLKAAKEKWGFNDEK